MSEHRITEAEELELRGRVAVLEEWTAVAHDTLRLTALGMIAVAVTAITLTLMLRKRLV